MPGQSIQHWQDTTSLPAPAALNAAWQHAPLYFRPQWHVGFLVYQAGVPILKRSALNGGGFFPRVDGPRGNQGNAWQSYQTPITSAVGSGSLPARPNFLTSLLGGDSTVGP